VGQNTVKQLYAVATLSVRETQVLRLLGDGKTTNEIAAELKITVKTVQDFYQKLKRKLRAENIHQLVRIALPVARRVRRDCCKGDSRLITAEGAPTTNDSASYGNAKKGAHKT
jgi:DNA-binding CsgD family transcriptional regulator